MALGAVMIAIGVSMVALNVSYGGLEAMLVRVRVENNLPTETRTFHLAPGVPSGVQGSSGLNHKVGYAEMTLADVTAKTVSFARFDLPSEGEVQKAVLSWGWGDYPVFTRPTELQCRMGTIGEWPEDWEEAEDTRIDEVLAERDFPPYRGEDPVIYEERVDVTSIADDLARVEKDLFLKFEETHSLGYFLGKGSEWIYWTRAIGRPLKEIQLFVRYTEEFYNLTVRAQWENGDPASVPMQVDDTELSTPFTKLLKKDNYTVIAPENFGDQKFMSWETGPENAVRTVNLDENRMLTAQYGRESVSIIQSSLFFFAGIALIFAGLATVLFYRF